MIEQQTAKALYQQYVREKGNLRQIIEQIERQILQKMHREGYHLDFLRTATRDSRIILLTADEEERNDFIRNILPEGAPEKKMLPNPVRRFNELYEGALTRIEASFRRADQEALKELSKNFPFDEVREAYRGESLFHQLAGKGNAFGIRYEHGILKDMQDRLQSLAKSEVSTMQDDFQQIWQVWESKAGVPLPYREGRALAAFLKKTGASEQTLRELLEKATAYAGRDKTAYVQRIAKEVIREKHVYQRLRTLPTEPEKLEELELSAIFYPIFLKKRMERLPGEQFLTYQDELVVANMLRDIGVPPTILKAGLHLSPARQTPGLDHDLAAKRLLGEIGATPFVTEDQDYARSKDIYCRLLVDCDNALIARKADFSVYDRREDYNIYATRKLLEEYGASEEEVLDILEAYGGIPEEERSQENLKHIIEKAREKKAAEDALLSPEEETAALVDADAKNKESPEIWKGSVKQRDNEKVRDRGEKGEEKEDNTVEKTVTETLIEGPIGIAVTAASIAIPEVGAAVTAMKTASAIKEVVSPSEKKEEKVRKSNVRETRQRVRNYQFETKREGDEGADEIYTKCAEEIQEATGTEHNDAVDEQLILYLFNQGYREEEIENVLDKNSPVPRRTHQANYGKSKIANTRKRHPEKCPAQREAIDRQARNYLQTKEREGKTMTEYDRVLIRQKDPVGVPQ